MATASYELFEILVLEPRPGSSVTLAVLIHSVQVGLILAVTFVALRAWREKTAHEEALGRMVEKVVVAQEEERRRIAFDVHDGIAQLIVSAKQHMNTSYDLWASDPGRAQHELATGLDRLERAIVETRRILMVLRPSAVDAIGLAAAVRQSLDEAAQEGGWEVTLTENLGELRLPPPIETAAFRIVQETLANATKHAKTPRVDVELRREPGSLRIDVRDYGTGFAAADEVVPGRGLGLLSMHERARLLGGSCRIDSRTGEGTRVTVRLPLNHESVDGRAE